MVYLVRIRVFAVSMLVVLLGVADVFGAGLSPDQLTRLRAFPAVDDLAVDSTGIPTSIRGRLGHIGFGPVDRSVHGYLAKALPLFRGAGEERFRTLRVKRDDRGQAHLRLGQEFRGLPIVGAELFVHVNESTGQVTGINGRFVPAVGLPTAAKVDASAALDSALRQAGITQPQLLEFPYLTYIADDGGAHLAWAARVAHMDDQGFQHDRIFADALDGSLVARHALIHRAKNRQIYTANYGTSLPGTLLISEGGSHSDFDAQKAYEYTGNTYDYLSARHGRDSWNGSGGTLIATVHYGSGYNNAYWNGTQTVFGDGDGVQWGPFARALDIVGHEWVHGVTEDEAGLVYANQSGALNEAMSDIFGAATEAYVRGVSSNTWKIGEDAYTPGTSGDAGRYMNNPTQDGASKDYYPERYTGSSDNGGVHWNSGIANLAFYLLSQGGTHPRGKTTVNVPSIGMTNAERIFYRALTTYMGSSTNFEGARIATDDAAIDNHGPCSSQREATQKAWDAVGTPRPSGRDYEPNDNIGQPNYLPGYSAYAAGYLCTQGNADWYSVTKHSSYSALSISLYMPSNSDYDLELWSNSGIRSVGYTTGNGVSEYVTWYYDAGTYYIKVFGKNGAYNTSSPYNLSISQ